MELAANTPKGSPSKAAGAAQPHCIHSRSNQTHFRINTGAVQYGDIRDLTAGSTGGGHND